MPHLSVGLRLRSSEQFQGLVLRGGGEGQVGGVGEQPPALDDAVNLVFEGVLVVIVGCRSFSQGLGHGAGGLPALAGVGLVDDDGEGPVPVVVSDVVQDEGELLDGGDDYLLALFDEPAEVSGPVGVGHGGGDLGELPDGPVYLSVQHPPVGDDDDGVEGVSVPMLDFDELPGDPGDGVGLSAPGGVLDEVFLPGSFFLDVRQELPHHVQLVVAGPDLPASDLLCVVLKDVGEAFGGEYLLPEVGGLDSAGVDRVAGAAVVPALVEGEEVGGLALELGAELSPPRRPRRSGRRTGPAGRGPLGAARGSVLLHGVGDGLAGEPVLELHGGDGEAVHEEADVQGQLLAGGAVP